MDYPKSVPGVGLASGKFVDENPATGTPGSLIPAQWGNSVTQEILNVILGAGLVPNEEDVTQLHRAILGLAASDYKKSVRCATTVSIGLSGLQTIDDVTLAAGDRVLVKNQDTASQNWIYVAAAGAWARAQDANESTECTPGHMVPVQAGTKNAGTVWQLVNTTVPVLGTTDLAFERLLGRSGVAAGDYTRVKVNKYGQVEEGSNPTTLSGNGISDAYTKAEADLRDLQRPLRDSITYVGLANNKPDAPYMRRESDGALVALQPSLGFTPVQQGGGTGQLDNKVKIGWSNNGLKAMVDNTDLGNLWYSNNFKPTDKADWGTTLAAYRIADAYTKAEVDLRDARYPTRDSITAVGLASNQPDAPYMRRESDGVVYYLQTKLSYTPIQQGTGIGQLGNPVKIGWSSSGLKATVDETDLGTLWASSNFKPSDKADKASTLSGYGITDGYTKAEIDLRDSQRPLADWVSTVGMSSNNPDLPYMRRASDNTVYYLQPRLGFAPVQQGTGAGQGNNLIKIGYDGTNPRITVDATDFGWIMHERNLMPVLGTQPAGGVGTYALLLVGGGATNVPSNPGDIVQGSSCLFSAASSHAAGAPTGTWRLMGYVQDRNLDATNSVTICLRVS
ncbi:MULTISPECIES: phage tail protein [Pseudomonas]|uniref:phage tail protein n=1 Tax=Pseudomonas TaxID=286 RepID=UPI000CD29176|nr:MULTISPECIES: phage tail protein [Pseudomonas]MCA5974507.1 phage tail protein [Pseudomonas sp. P135]MCF5029884.1 phage tail protein [Pseudomonas syringae]MCH5552637.1 phage tail protein [Pseudomonas syringae pv. syringae]MCH5570803.1 phage tail protein [Pseudomonas syringae pv. syringae]MEE1994078.1 phage tail protein [Pseudomonas syringae pv. syringae]